MDQLIVISLGLNIPQTIAKPAAPNVMALRLEGLPGPRRPEMALLTSLTSDMPGLIVMTREDYLPTQILSC